jgi:hypothetical protein
VKLHSSSWDLSKGLKVARALGLQALVSYAVYRLGLLTGYWRRQTLYSPTDPEKALPLRKELFEIPKADVLITLLGKEGVRRAIELADEIIEGRFRPFGGPPTRLVLEPPQPLRPWVFYTNKVNGVDIKSIWEAARLGWVFPMGRAYVLTGDEKYARACWRYLEHFLQTNPPGWGPNWASAQEVALRIPVLLFAAQVFGDSKSFNAAAQAVLSAAVIDHARRIPITLSYAIAQNNNHLLSEALGIYLAGLALPDHPKAKRWKRLGKTLFERGLHRQIASDGRYVQNSHNYHRLMLHLALLYDRAIQLDGDGLSPEMQRRLEAAVKWLAARVDTCSGFVPNYGHNDGSNILPLGSFDVSDYRPVVQAAALCFLKQAYFPSGPWDELAAWLGLEKSSRDEKGNHREPPPLDIIRPQGNDTWAMIQVARYHGRPAHADQLHVDIWVAGENLVCDAGTFAYNAPPPWENGLASTLVHNTVRVDGYDQMTRLGQFLWVDWAQGRILNEASLPGQRCVAEHDGYRWLGILHRRSLLWEGEGRWKVNDELLQVSNPASSHRFDVHWLLCDGLWKWEDDTLEIVYRSTRLLVRVGWAQSPEAMETRLVTLRLIRSGTVIYGPDGDFPTLGWYSPTYLVRQPALSLLATFQGTLPLNLWTEFRILSL